MASLKQRARAVAMAAISEEDVQRDPARAFGIALGAARGFLASAIDARRAEALQDDSVHESAVAKPDVQPSANHSTKAD